MKIIFILSIFLFSSCQWWCSDKECYDAKIQYESMLHKNDTADKILKHNQEIERIKVTPVQVQVEEKNQSVWEWIGEAAAIATMGYWAIKVLEILTKL